MYLIIINYFIFNVNFSLRFHGIDVFPQNLLVRVIIYFIKLLSLFLFSTGCGVNDVKGQLESVIYHAGEVHLQQSRGFLQARIRVHFDQPRPQLLVYHEIVPENFELMLLGIGV